MMFNNLHGMWNYWIFGMFLMLLVAIYVSNDASQFGENGMLWALIVFFMPMMGLLFYLVIRSTWTRSVEQQVYRNNMNSHANTVPPRREAVNVGSTNSSMSNSFNQSKSNPKVKADEFNETQFCTTCGTENSRDARYCNSCGAEIRVI